MTTLTCQIETARVLLGLVVAYLPWFFYSDDFFHFWTLWVLSGLCFFKVLGDVAIKKTFHSPPLLFFRYHCSKFNPCGFYAACVFNLKSNWCGFYKGDVFRSNPYGFYLACDFHSFSHDVFILSAASIWQGRVLYCTAFFGITDDVRRKST